MSSFIAHMLIAKKTKDKLLNESTDCEFSAFVNTVIVANEELFMLGSVGPDMPYFENILKTVWVGITDKAYKPKGVEPYSYQLHSKSPNVMPLKLLEITWKESDLNQDNWDNVDKARFAFSCGYLCHMATDHIIHPVVQKIAGAYYKRKEKGEKGSREIHTECETAQDLFLFSEENENKFYYKDFRKSKFPDWCSLKGTEFPKEVILLIQKAFIEANSINPGEKRVGKWVKGTTRTMKLSRLPFITPHAKAYKQLFENGKINKDSPFYCSYINLDKLDDDKNYSDYVQQAIELCSIYIKAAYVLYDSCELDDKLRREFKSIVRNADLTYPLDVDILKDAKENLNLIRPALV